MLILAACGSSNKVVDPQRAEAIKQLLESGQYYVMVGSMRPLSAPTMSVRR